MLIRLLTVMILGLSSEWLPAMEIADDQWRLVKSHDGIKVYMAHSDESRLKTFRGVTQVDLPDPNALTAVLDDYQAAPKWLHFVDTMEDLGRNSDTDRYLRVTTNLPWPLKDREALIRALVEQDPETLNIDVRFINSPGLLPENKGFTRFPEFYGHLKVDFIEDSKAIVTYEVIVDPGGIVPLWISNLILKETPYFTLKRLKKMLTKSEYQGKHFSYLKVPGDEPSIGNTAAEAVVNSESGELQKPKEVLMIDEVGSVIDAPVVRLVGGVVACGC